MKSRIFENPKWKEERYRVKVYKNEDLIALRREVKLRGKWKVMTEYEGFSKYIFPAVARLLEEQCNV